MSKKILLEDVFNGYCEHIQCEYNYKESCDYGSCINEYMEYKKGNDFAICNGFKVKNGYCEDCGSELTKFTDMLPYGDTHVPYVYYECNNCDQRGDVLIYRLYVYDKRAKVYDTKGDYKTKQSAETKAKPFTDKGKEVKIIPLPTKEIKIGMKVYKSDDELYGEIIDESGSFWYIRRTFKDEDDRAFFLKDNFIEKYENGIFIMKGDDQLAYTDKIFKDNLRNVLENGVWDTDYNVRPKWTDGTPAHTKYITHVVNTYDIAKEGLPILTIRPIAWKTGLKEILWIYQDQTNDVNLLEEKYNVNYWREWVNREGNLGKSYGYQLAKEIDFPEGRFKQLDRIIHLLKTNPMDRRMTTNMLNLEELKDMTLPPCCYETWWYVRDGYLDMMLIQRSGDLLPAAGALNVTQYALLLIMISQATGYRAGKMTHVINNLHVYDKHISIAEELLSRKEYEQPILHVNTKVKDFYDFTVDDFKLENYQHGEKIKDIPIAI